MAEPIIFYDIIGKSASHPVAWSPSAWKARFALNYKRIPYRTQWLEYPDIQVEAKKLGANPTGVQSNGDPKYTVPMIYDPSTQTVVTESFDIVRYLDKTYPDTPKLLPPGSNALIAAFATTFRNTVVFPLAPAVSLAMHDFLTERSIVFFREQRAAVMKRKPEELSPPGEAEEQVWKNIEKGFGEVATWLEANEGSVPGAYPPFVMGETPSFADVVIAASLKWTRTVLGEDSARWRNMREWNGGRWAIISDFWEKYSEVV